MEKEKIKIRRVVLVVFLSLFLSENIWADESIDGRWYFGENGTYSGGHSGEIEFTEENGVLFTNDFTVVNLSNIQLSEKGSLGQRKTSFSTPGSITFTYVGWISFNICKMVGYFVQDGKESSEEAPWNAMKKSCIDEVMIPYIGTVSSNLDISIPSITYLNSLGRKNIWVDFEFSHEENGEFYWKLKKYGENQ